ncbi:MAG TPA: Ig-like domain-containing protein, partial [Candidatus Paceibacterota bacterium]|nr:Ig-like domain-containing protein [Candidatus Paceibacterota bacterium]
DEAKTRYDFTLTDEHEKKYNLHFAKGKPGLLTGSVVKVKGTVLDNELVLADGSNSSDNTSLQTVQAASVDSMGDQHTLAVMVNFRNNPTQPYTKSSIYGRIFSNTDSTNVYYKESSYDLTGFTGEVTDWITIPYDGLNCSSMLDTWTNAANQAATAAGYNLSNYNRHLYVLAGVYDCGWGGLSYVGGNPSRSWVVGTSNAIIDHELGHAIGMWHASSFFCGTKQIDAYINCSQSEYGDLYDVMGGGSNGRRNQQNGPHKAQQGWVPQPNVQTVTTSGTYTIASLETKNSAVQVLKIAKPNTSQNYYIDYRQPSGFDSTLPSTMTSGAGVLIWGTSGNTMRLDSIPGDNDISNSALSDSRSFQDPINGITITQVSHTASEVTLQVTFSPSTCIKAKPSMSVSPLSQTGSAGEMLRYTVSLKNNDTVGCGTNSSFDFSATGLPAGFTGTSASLFLPPGASGSVSFEVTSPTGLAEGTYLFNIVAQDYNDTVDSLHTASVQASYSAFTDTIAPKITITKPAAGATFTSKSKIQISASATDSAGVAKMELLFDSKVLKTCSLTTSCSVTYSPSPFVAGSHVITATATDKGGNKGSVNVSITLSPGSGNR